jgi:hypothetical protein
MSPEEVIGKFLSFELMIKDSKHIVNLEQGATSTPEVQPVAFKATEEEESTPSRFPIAHHQELLPNPQTKEGEGLQVLLQKGVLLVW